MEEKAVAKGKDVKKRALSFISCFWQRKGNYIKEIPYTKGGEKHE